MSRYRRHKTLIHTVYPKLEVLEKERPQVFAAVKRLKKVRDETLLARFGLELKTLIERRYGRDFDAITCPPIRQGRIKKGYSPVSELGKRVSTYLGIDFVTFFKNGRGIYPERYQTAAKRFREGRLSKLELKVSPKGLKVLLIDDVTVTNQTFVICTETLYRQGASLVRCIALVG